MLLTMKLAMRRRHILPILGLALGLSFAPGLAHAKKGKGGGKLDKICAEIGCSADQKREIGEVFEQMKIDIKSDRTALKELKKQLAAEWIEDKPSERKIASLSAKMAAHERNIADRKLEAMIELHGLLDAKQRAKVAEQLMKRGKH